MGEQRVSVVVVTYNALPWIERCLESARGHETIVVDHGSTDGTLELVRRRFPEAKLLEQERPEARRDLPDQPGSDHQLVRQRLRVGRGFLLGREQEV